MNLKIYDLVEQRSDAWFKLRNGKITGSTCKDFLSKKGTITRNNAIQKKATELFLGKTCDEELPFSLDIDRGVKLEPIARTKYENKTNNKVKEVGFIVPIIDGVESQYLGYSPDGLVGEDGLIEIKCPRNHIYTDRVKNGCPKDYMIQIQFGLYISGRKWCDFINYNEDFEAIKGCGLNIQRIERDEEMINSIKSNCEEAIEEIKSYVLELDGFSKKEIKF